MMQSYNTAIITGHLEGELTVDHTILGESFYTGTVAVRRTSGAVDSIPVTVPGRLLESLELNIFDGNVTVTGQMRSYNKTVDGAGRLILTLFAQNIEPSDGDDTMNQINLVGTLCKLPNYRVTPFGREICDMMLAVNRGFGKSDYIPCIVWGRNSVWASKLVPGDRITISGRMQSRLYEKLHEDGSIETRTAYELSVFQIERCPVEMMASI